MNMKNVLQTTARSRRLGVRLIRKKKIMLTCKNLKRKY